MFMHSRRIASRLGFGNRLHRKCREASLKASFKDSLVKSSLVFQVLEWRFASSTSTWECITIRELFVALEVSHFNLSALGSSAGRFTTSLLRSAMSCLGRSAEILGTPRTAYRSIRLRTSPTRRARQGNISSELSVDLCVITDTYQSLSN